MATDREIEEQALALLSRKWDTSEPGYVEGVKAYLNDPDTLLSAQDQVAQAEASLEEAKARLRGAVAAASASGLSQPKIGKMLGIPRSAVRRLMASLTD